MEDFDDKKLYSIRDLALLSGIREVTLRQRLLQDEPQIFLKAGIIHIKGVDAKKLLLFRKRGRKKTSI